jgi:hypothetical protein
MDRSYREKVSITIEFILHPTNDYLFKGLLTVKASIAKYSFF